MTTPEPLDLKLNYQEKSDVGYAVGVKHGWTGEFEDLTAEDISVLGDAIADAAAAKAALFFRVAGCWCDVAIGNPMMGGRHSLKCETAKAVVEAAGIQKPEEA